MASTEQSGRASEDEKYIHYLMDIAKANRDRASELEHAFEEGRLEGMRVVFLESKHKAKLKIAANMISAGLTTDFILQVTELTLDEISKLNEGA